MTAGLLLILVLFCLPLLCAALAFSAPNRLTPRTPQQLVRLVPAALHLVAAL